jgi:hypothetical protein
MYLFIIKLEEEIIELDSFSFKTYNNNNNNKN